LRAMHRGQKCWACSPAGTPLKGGELAEISPTAEMSALSKLMANWQSVVEDAAQTPGEKEERQKGQKQLI